MSKNQIISIFRDEDFPDRSPRGIAGVVARLIGDGVCAPADRLPTVRDVADLLAVSPATVSAAWQALSRTGLIESRGRAGTFVCAPRREWLSPRVQGLSARSGSPRLDARPEMAHLDLSRGTPDPALLPSLEAAFSHLAPRADTAAYHDLPVIPELADELARTWPTRAESITVVDGALDGISRVLESVVRFGDRVVLESPGFPYFFDLVEAVGGEVVTVDVDGEGMVPESLARALLTRPVAIIVQPRAQNPTGASMSTPRAQALAAVVHADALHAENMHAAKDRRRVVIVEDDHSGSISMAPDVSLATWLPDQVVHVRSYSKSHGPDLRIAALGGPSHLVEAVVARRMLGPGWTSRLLQSVLWTLLSDPDSVATVRDARLTYRDRVDQLVSALRRRGVDVGVPDGLNLWVPVQDERAALVHLAAAGIAVAAGTPFLGERDGGQESAPPAGASFVRVTAGALASGVEDVAASVAQASRALAR